MRARTILVAFLALNVAAVLWITTCTSTTYSDRETAEKLQQRLTDAGRNVEHLAAERDRLQRELNDIRARTTPSPSSSTQPLLPLPTPALPVPGTMSNDSIASAPRWLIVGIPTVPRTDGADYLTPVLKSLLAEMKGVFGSGLVRVVVMNNRPGAHKVFDKAKKTFHMYAESGQIEFVDNKQHYGNTPVPIAPEFAESRHERPDDRVRQQSLDVAALLLHVQGKSKYFLFYEDDFVLCRNGMMALDYMTRKADLYMGTSKWAAIRCSFGLNGIVLQNHAPNNDVLAFHKYLLEHFTRRPPDHLVVEWYAKEASQARSYFSDRHVMAFRYNIAQHVGTVSTLRAESPWSTPGCFHELIAPQLFPVEAWNPVDCPQDDIWPCDFKAATPVRLVWNTSGEAKVSSNRIIYVEKNQVLDNKLR